MTGSNDVVIDGTHISILKPDNFYFKSSGYTLNCKAVVNSNKRILDLYLGMPGSSATQMTPGTRDGSSLFFRKATHHEVHGFPPHLLDDSLPFASMINGATPRGTGQLTVAEQLYNRKLRRGHCVVENAFGIEKKLPCHVLGTSMVLRSFR